VPWRRLDGEADGFEPSNEFANVLSHPGTSNRRGCMSRRRQSPRCRGGRPECWEREFSRDASVLGA
jgi:hypothetical protein